MKEEHEFDASNPADVKAKRKAGKDLQQVRDEGLRYILEHPGARSYVNELLEMGKMFQTTFHPNAQIFALNEGHRNLCLKLYADIARVDSNKIVTLMNEKAIEDNIFNQSQKQR